MPSANNAWMGNPRRAIHRSSEVSRYRCVREVREARVFLVTLLVTAIYVGWVWTTSPLDILRQNHPIVAMPLPIRLNPTDYRQACDADQVLGHEVQQDWKRIDEILSKQYPDMEVSGGIFLYRRQASLLTTLIQLVVARKSSPVTICETGFGAGHSLALFANAAENLKIVSFDRFNRPYQLPLWKRWNETYASRKHHTLSYVEGDSCKTTPQTLTWKDTLPSTSKNGEATVQCDILHGSSLCGTDNIDLVEHSPCGALLTSTAMGSITDRAVYFGPKAQWRRLRDRGCITDPICFQEEALQLERDFHFAKQGSVHEGQFCVSMSTGRCRPSATPTEASIESTSCTAGILSILSELSLDRLCPQFQIPVPP